MGDYGIKVTRAGYDITSTEEREYVFWSKYQAVKIYSQGSGTVTIPSGSSTNDVSIAHGLSFIPMYLLFSQLMDASGKWFLNRTDEGGSSPGSDDQYVRGGYTFPPYVEIGLYVDATNLHIGYGTYDNTENHDIDYYYYLFGDKGGQ